jgi:hypothetical protein
MSFLKLHLSPIFKRHNRVGVLHISEDGGKSRSRNLFGSGSYNSGRRTDYKN